MEERRRFGSLTLPVYSSTAGRVWLAAGFSILPRKRRYVCGGPSPMVGEG